MRRYRATLLLGLLVAGIAVAASQAGASVLQKSGVRTLATPTRIGHFGGLVRPVVTATATSPTGWDPHNPVGTPPLTNHGGPVMGTRSTADKVVLTPIYWAGAGYSFAASYKKLLTRFLKDAAADSDTSGNVFSTVFEYSGSNGAINYHFTTGAAINDSNAFPAAGCTTNSGAIYGDGSGYTTCLDDAQLQSEIEAQITANGLTRDLGHIYVLFLPKHVESCFYAGNPSGQACTVNYTPSAAYCAYHSYTGANSVYATMPFPIYQSGTGYSCTDEHLGTHAVQTPNSNPDADVETSPTSHEISEAITDPHLNAWYDSSGNENGDECAYEYGTLGGTDGGFFNQTIHGHHYLLQEEFSNHNFAIGQGGCLQTYVPATKPAVKSLSSHSGSTAGGATVTINGSNLAGATSVKFGATAATFTVVDNGKIKVTTPAHAAGTVDVKVTSAAGTSATVSGDTYTFS